MELDQVKRWQWILIGLLAGLGLGWVWSGSDVSTSNVRQLSQIDFERDLGRTHQATKQPLIRGIVVNPPMADYSGKQVQIVTFERLMQGQKTGKTYYVPSQFVAMVPYKPFINAPRPTVPDLTINQYLVELAKRNETIRYRYGWMQERPIAITVWTLGTALIVGGIWPTLLNMLVGAGLGPKHEKKQKREDYFDRFSHAPEPQAVKASSAMTAAERDKLEEMNRQMESRLGGAGAVSQMNEQSAAAGHQGEVRKLEGGPLEATPIPKNPADEDDEVEVKGEFYPVLIHHKKHHDDENPDGAHPEHPDQKE